MSVEPRHVRPAIERHVNARLRSDGKPELEPDELAALSVPLAACLRDVLGRANPWSPWAHLAAASLRVAARRWGPFRDRA